MVALVDKQVVRTGCIIAILAAATSIGSLILGFVSMGTFYTSSLYSSVGIWCGLLMMLHIITAIFLLGTRKLSVGVIYTLANIICLALLVYGVVIAYDYYDAFSRFKSFNDQGLCSAKYEKCECIGITTTGVAVFKEGFAVSSCPLFSFGEDIWMMLVAFLILNAFWCVLGIIAGLVAFGAICSRRSERKLMSKYDNNSYRAFSSYQPRMGGEGHRRTQAPGMRVM